MSFNKLVDSNYKYGSIPRQFNKGYNSYYHMIFSDIYIDVTNENRVILDSWMKDQLHDADQYETYIKEVDAFINNMDNHDNKTDEELYNDIRKIRSRYIDDKITREKRSVDNNCIKNNTKEYSEMTDLIFYDNETIEKKTLINDIGKYRQLLNQKEALIIIPESYTQLTLLGSYMKGLCSMGKKIFLLLKEKPVLDMASLEHFEAINDAKVSELRASNTIQLIIEKSLKYGFDYAKLVVDNRDTMQQLIESEQIFTLAFGEHALLGIKDFNIESIVMTKIQSFKVREMTLLLEDAYNYAIVYVPKHFNIYNHVIHNERSRLTYFQLSQIGRKNNYNNEELKDISLLFRKYPEYFFNIYSKDSSNEVLKEMAGYEILDYYDFVKKKDEKMMDHINHTSDKATYIKRYYDLNTLQAVAYNPLPQEKKNCVMIDGILLDGNTGAEVVIKDSSDNNNNIRNVARDNHLDKGDYLLFNFMFFLTQKVSMLYNQLRKDRIPEQIGFSSGHMDYRYYKDNSQDIETFPLYNKACIGLTDKGKFKFFNKRLKGGQISINNYTLEWQGNDVNTFDSKEVIVYTPYLSKDMACDNYSQFCKEVGHNRFNIVIVNEHIITMRKGNVILPPLGVVISLDERIGDNFVTKNHLKEKENGYYDVEGLTYKLHLESDFQKDFKWAFGGGLTIIKDNVNLFKNKEIGSKILKEEGWLSPLSMQTQESNIHELSRHPRTAFGMTGDNQFFGIVFSGRTKENAGVDYIEMADIALKEFKDIKCMMNVDGGASSLLALIKNKELFELNYPGASPTSTAGMARPINSMLIIEI